ncbi:MAG: TonB-dependent receptor [Rikenellaceae bacterium]
MMRISQLFYKSLLLSFCALVLSVQSYAQSIEVNGVVTDASGQPIIGATVTPENAAAGGAITDLDGAFTLRAVQGSLLYVNFIGYVEYQVKAKANLAITLQEDAQAIDDVVVIGYGAVRKKEVTGAVASLGEEDITRQLTTDLGSALQGMVSGVSVAAESSAPGSGSSILIRGVSSINGGNTPLYVVDGVPQEGDPGISPNEIQTIDILKDAASCAIYGTRGAAGVILITTKQGQSGKMKVTLDANYGIKSIISNTYLMGTVDQTYVDIVNDRVSSGYSNDENTYLNLSKKHEYFYNDTNLLEEQVYINTATTQNYTATISGGANGLTYSVVAGYTDQDGNVINSSYNKFNTRINLNYTSGKVKMNVSAGLSQANTESSPSGLILQAIKYYPTQNTIDYGDYSTSEGTEKSNITSILSNFYLEDNTKTVNTFANYNLSYDVTDNFMLTGRVAISETSSLRHKFSPYIKIYDSTGDEVSEAEDSYVSMTSTSKNSMVWDFGAQYKKALGLHHFTALATATGEVYNMEGFTAYQEGVLDNSIDVLDGTSINPSVDSSAGYTNKLIGTIGRLQYDWNTRYLLSASVRVDGSSKFATSNQWGVFPSASAAWNVSDEPFFQPVTRAINNLKVRASYGTTGNQSFSAYSYTSAVTTGYDYVAGTSTSQTLNLGTIQASYANADIKWETTRQYNIGVDFGFFDNKVTLTAEYYKTDKSDMLFPVTLAGSNGSTSTLIMNVGNMTNQGVELAASYHSNIGKVNYGINATFATNNNEITKINGSGARVLASSTGLLTGAASTSYITYFAEGYPAASFFLYPTNGIINTEEKLAEYQKLDSTAEMGDLIYVDTDGDGSIIDDDDRVYCGSGLPEIEIGFNLSLSYKNFDLFANFYSALGHELVNGSRATAYTYGRHQDLVGAYSEWNTDSPIPTYRGDTKSHNNYRGDSDLWVEDGSYLRLKNLTFGYTLPAKVIKQLNISKVRFYISAQNLWTLTGYTGYNPEVGSGIATRGMDFGTYPALATYTCGVNLIF